MAAVQIKEQQKGVSTLLYARLILLLNEEDLSQLILFIQWRRFWLFKGV